MSTHKQWLAFQPGVAIDKDGLPDFNHPHVIAKTPIDYVPHCHGQEAPEGRVSFENPNVPTDVRKCEVCGSTFWP